MSRLVLASGSSRRADLLRRLGFEFDIAIPDVDESPYPGEEAEAMAERLALAKALSVGISGPVVLAADTIVVDGDSILGKPEDPDTAVAMLQRLRGREHRVLSGCAVVAGDVATTALVTTRVWMGNVSDAEIKAYVATGEPLDKAGAYAIQEQGGRLVAALQGSFTNVVGLPLEWVVPALEAAGVSRPPYEQLPAEGM